jgi:hypothetical protein
VGFDALTIHIVVFRVVIHCSLVGRNKHSQRKYCLHTTTGSLTSTYHDKRCHNPMDHNMNSWNIITRLKQVFICSMLGFCDSQCRGVKIPLTDLMNALPRNSSLNTVQRATDEAVFSMSSAPNSGGTTGLCNPFLSNGSVNTRSRKR